MSVFSRGLQQQLSNMDAASLAGSAGTVGMGQRKKDSKGVFVYLKEKSTGNKYLSGRWENDWCTYLYACVGICLHACVYMSCVCVNYVIFIAC